MESDNNGSDSDKADVVNSAADGTTQPLSCVTHLLAERLMAMTIYFAAARRNLDKGNIEAAEQSFLRLYQQTDRTREIAEQICASMKERRL